MNELLFKSIQEISALIKDRKVSPVELTQATLSHISETDPLLNAFPVLKADQALAEARRAEAEITNGDYRGPFHGIPVGFKDNLSVEGWVTSCGSPILADHITDTDAAVVERLRHAGAVVIGKNNMHEWALAGSCTYSIFGTVHNPWDPSRTSGGSSGGSGAAVSAGQAFLSIGTDARASVRNPASYCGVVGHKPSTGLISRYGEIPATSAWYMVVGPLARTVGDAALAMNVLAGYDPRDPNSLRSPAIDYTPNEQDTLKGLRVGLPINYFFDDTVAEVESAIKAAARSFEQLGAEIVDITLPSLEHMQLIEPSFESENKGWLLPYALHRGQDFLHQDIRFRILAGAFARTIDHERASRLLNKLRWETQEAFERVDVIITPTNSTAAYRLDEPTTLIKGGEIDVESANGQSRVTTRLTVPFNALGLPAISLPCGFTSEGMPIGLQIAGRHFDDKQVINVAAAYERNVGPGYRQPPLMQRFNR